MVWYCMLYCFVLTCYDFLREKDHLKFQREVSKWLTMSITRPNPDAPISRIALTYIVLRPIRTFSRFCPDLHDARRSVG